MILNGAVVFVHARPVVCGVGWPCPDFTWVAGGTAQGQGESKGRHTPFVKQ